MGRRLCAAGPSLALAHWGIRQRIARGEMARSSNTQHGTFLDISIAIMSLTYIDTH